MKKNGNTFAILLVLCGIAMLLWFAILAPAGINWKETYKTNELQPYDLQVFYELVDSSTAKEISWSQEPLSKQLAGKNGVNYFFVGDVIYLDTINADTLVEFIERGNYGLIAQVNIPEDLFYVLNKRGYGNFYLSAINSWDINTNFYPDQIHLDENQNFLYFSEKAEAPNWTYFDDFDLDSLNENVTKLGYFNSDGYDDDFCNFYYIKLGKGRLYLHTNPILFTNYFIIEEGGFDYAGAIMSYFPDKPIVWDNYHNHYYDSVDEPAGNSPLKFIFSQQSLSYAWYTLLGSFLMFLIFRVKREQRIIPLLPTTENTSIDFSKSLGALYHQSKSPKYITIEMLKLFDNFNRRKFGINRKPKDENIAKKIALKSKVDVKLLDKIFVQERKIIYNPKADMKEIIPLYQALEEYYQKTK